MLPFASFADLSTTMLAGVWIFVGFFRRGRAFSAVRARVQGNCVGGKGLVAPQDLKGF